MQNKYRLVVAVLLLSTSVRLLGMIFPCKDRGDISTLRECVKELQQGLPWNKIAPCYQFILLKAAEMNGGLRVLCEHAGADVSSLKEPERKAVENGRFSFPHYHNDCPSVLFPGSDISVRCAPGQLRKCGDALRKRLAELDEIVLRLREGVYLEHVPADQRDDVLRHWKELEMVKRKYLEQGVKK
ncbi:hypothetical protein E3J61_00440 [Candidatus Dependentiae bacterium]|nr:MAG: hypothetical protein E3J61_00440 [Candidatus Dependentiae bacterium]